MLGQRARRREVRALQLLSLALILVSGSATLTTSDPRYVMAKPSMIAVVVGIFMLRPGWLARYIPADLQSIIVDVTMVFGFVWAGPMFLTAGLNMVFVLHYPEHWRGPGRAAAGISGSLPRLFEADPVRLSFRDRRRGCEPQTRPATAPAAHPAAPTMTMLRNHRVA